MTPTTKEGWERYVRAGVYRGPDPLTTAEDVAEFEQYLREAEARAGKLAPPEKACGDRERKSQQEQSDEQAK